MSSPLSTLKKTPKLPLPRYGSDPPPDNFNTYNFFTSSKNAMPDTNFNSVDENKLLEEVTSDIVAKKMTRKHANPFKNPLPELKPNETSANDSKNKSKNDVPSDGELMALMMSRISILEKQVKDQALDIYNKTKNIKVLREKLEILEKSQNSDHSPNYVKDLEAKCLLQQQKISEMENFLADYGLVWVGENSEGESRTYIDDTPSETSLTGKGKNFVWKPSDAVATTFHVNYDLIAHNIKELNLTAGEGQSVIEQTSDGARFKSLEAVSLTLYKNGLVLFNGPFRSLSDFSTQAFLKDLQDGYFPSELQTRYPDGVPLKLTDRREVAFRDKKQAAFGGSGQSLRGPNEVTDYKAGMISAVQLIKETPLPGPKVNIDQFLTKIPANIVRDGKIIPIRAELKEHLTQFKSSERLQKLTGDGDLQAIGSEEPHATTSEMTTLRIHSPTGDRLFTFTLRTSNTIADVRKNIDERRHPSSASYEILLPYPLTVLNRDDATLLECGLSKNCVLHMKVKNPEP